MFRLLLQTSSGHAVRDRMAGETPATTISTRHTSEDQLNCDIRRESLKSTINVVIAANKLSKEPVHVPGNPLGPEGPGAPGGPTGPGGPDAKLDNLTAVLSADTYRHLNVNM